MGRLVVPLDSEGVFKFESEAGLAGFESVAFLFRKCKHRDAKEFYIIFVSCKNKLNRMIFEMKISLGMEISSGMEMVMLDLTWFIFTISFLELI